MSEYLFSYGTLQKEKVQIKLFGRTLRGCNDILCSYKLKRVEITDDDFLASGEESIQQTLIVSEDHNDNIMGTVFEITKDELLLADKYEPENYIRKEVILQSGKKAWTYLAV